jgi:VanZ family protein
MKQFIIKLIKAHKDKVYHFFCSYTAMLTFTAVAIIKFGAPIGWSINFGIACAVLVGVAKEFYDLYIKKSKFSVADLIADILGIVVACTVLGV